MICICGKCKKKFFDRLNTFFIQHSGRCFECERGKSNKLLSLTDKELEVVSAMLSLLQGCLKWKGRNYTLNGEANRIAFSKQDRLALKRAKEKAMQLL